MNKTKHENPDCDPLIWAYISFLFMSKEAKLVDVYSLESDDLAWLEAFHMISEGYE